MGVYIEGMEMPKDDCTAYRSIIITNNWVDEEMRMLAHDANTNEFIGEVIDLPPHGRLIDGDRAEKELAFDYAYAAAKMVKEMPTIIPAEL